MLIKDQALRPGTWRENNSNGRGASIVVTQNASQRRECVSVRCSPNLDSMRQAEVQTVVRCSWRQLQRNKGRGGRCSDGKMTMLFEDSRRC